MTLKRKLIYQSDLSGPRIFFEHLESLKHETLQSVETVRLKGRVRQEINARWRLEYLGGGVWGHAPPGNFVLRECDFQHSEGQLKLFNCCKFKSIFCVKKDNYADNVDTGRDPENWSICCFERLR